MAQLEGESLFLFGLRQPQRCSDFVRACERTALGLISDISAHMRDSQEELAALLGKEAARVHEINEQRRHAATHASEVWELENVQPSFYRSLREMAVVLNLHYTTGLRKCFNRSVATLADMLATGQLLLEEALGKTLAVPGIEITSSDIELLSHDAALDRRVRSKTLQLELTLAFGKTSGSVELRPSPSGLTAEILGLVAAIAGKLEAIPAVQAPEAGLARPASPDSLCTVFPECTQGHLADALARLKSSLEATLRLPAALAALVA